MKTKPPAMPKPPNHQARGAGKFMPGRDLHKEFAAMPQKTGHCRKK